jgi:hypothetical protein
MGNVIVTKNTGEVAHFSDGGVINRQRLECCTATGVNYVKCLDRQIFQNVFAIGLTKTEVNQSLLNPGSSDGVPEGRNIPDTRFATRPLYLSPAGASAADLRAEADRLIKRAEDLEKE